MKAYTQIPPGTQILIGRAARRRRVLERAICSVFEGWSYEEIIPPIFDYYDVFVKGMGTGPEEQIYRFIDREGNILALRPGVYVACREDCCHAPGIVAETDPAFLFAVKCFASRSRKAAGSGSLLRSASSTMAVGKTADVEILLIAVEAFERLGIQGFQINLGSVDFFGGIVDRMELPETANRGAEGSSERQGSARTGIIAADSSAGRPPQKDSCGRFRILRAAGQSLQEARRLVRNPRSVEALDHLEEIYSIFERLDLAQHLTIDLGEIRGFDYYTGILFRAYVRGLGFEVAGGGRYDGLPGRSARIFRPLDSRSAWTVSSKS